MLISATGIPLLADFGISRLMTASITATTSTASVKGSTRWMAVELLKINYEATSLSRNSAEHTKETDVWAYGMVIYVGVMSTFAVRFTDTLLILPSSGITNRRSAIQNPQARCSSIVSNYSRPHATPPKRNSEQP